MALSGAAFVKELHGMVRRKHSKDHPIIGMIEGGELTRDQLKGFVGQHRGLYIRFAKACGFPKEELDRVEPLPETEAFLDWRELLMYQRSWLELYASQGFCLEGTAGERMSRIVNGLTKHYGFDRNSEDIRYWMDSSYGCG